MEVEYGGNGGESSQGDCILTAYWAGRQVETVYNRGIYFMTDVLDVQALPFFYLRVFDVYLYLVRKRDLSQDRHKLDWSRDRTVPAGLVLVLTGPDFVNIHLSCYFISVSAQ